MGRARFHVSLTLPQSRSRLVEMIPLRIYFYGGLAR
jgi:hypothetical protein